MITLPIINIAFKQLATSLISRTGNGVAVLIVKDSTEPTGTLSVYKNITDVLVDEKLYSAESLQAMKDVVTYAVGKLVVVKTDANKPDLAAALSLIEKKIKNCWIGIVDATEDETATLVSWIKSKELLSKQYKALVHKGVACDCKHIVNLMNEKVTFADSRGVASAVKFIPTLLGILASCNVLRGTTNYKCETLSSVEEPEDIDTVINTGGLVLINDEDIVRIGVGINSMTTTNGKTNTEDMKFIENVEAMDQIQLDIHNVFKNEYVGNFKNSLDNQMLFIASVKTYFKELAKDEILDKEYDNTVDIDVETQRAAWVGTGKTEAKDWSEEKVKKMSFKRTVFLTGNIKILSSIQDLDFTINLA